MVLKALHKVLSTVYIQTVLINVIIFILFSVISYLMLS
jgi:hypothetical protein